MVKIAKEMVVMNFNRFYVEDILRMTHHFKTPCPKTRRPLEVPYLATLSALRYPLIEWSSWVGKILLLEKNKLTNLYVLLKTKQNSLFGYLTSPIATVNSLP